MLGKRGELCGSKRKKKKKAPVACVQFTGCFICVIIFETLTSDVLGNNNKKSSCCLAMTHLCGIPRCFREGNELEALFVFLYLKRPVMSKQCKSDNMYTLESFERRNRTNENHVSGFFFFEWITIKLTLCLFCFV